MKDKSEVDVAISRALTENDFQRLWSDIIFFFRTIWIVC